MEENAYKQAISREERRREREKREGGEVGSILWWAPPKSAPTATDNHRAHPLPSDIAENISIHLEREVPLQVNRQLLASYSPTALRRKAPPIMKHG